MLDTAEDVIDHWHKVPSGPLHGVNPLKVAISVTRITTGILRAFRLLRKIKPDVIFLTGGWVGIPVALTGQVLRIPIVIFVPDVEPGRTLKFLGRFASVVTATTADTKQYYPGKKVVETGYPLRPELLQATREQGIAHFGLDENKRTLLVFGGSRGSRAINNAILDHIEELMAVPDLQILHVSGKLDAEVVRQQHDKLSNDIKSRYHLYDYVDEFGLAFAASDLVVSRAGAATIGEFPIFGLPAILVPLAYEWRYQEVNADWLASRNAAVRLDEPLMDEQLVPLIVELLTDAEKMQKLRDGVQSLSRTDGADNIAHIILDLVG
jgi:UDP-N-acetylglucosamine--N-acetylmuramyl-(pentapeptide) pyrophosphoryl-undecaprenol N-acetylglucosamine transferase